MFFIQCFILMINVGIVLCQLHFASYQSHKPIFSQFLAFKHLEFVNGREALSPDQVSNLWADLTLLSGTILLIED